METNVKRSNNFKDITNQRFGKLTAVRFSHIKKEKAIWLFKCDCGKEIYTIASTVKSGKTSSCGCIKKQTGERNIKWQGYKEISLQYLSRIKINAKKRNINFQITIQEMWDIFIQQNRKCALSGVILRFNSHSNSHDGNASLDRINSNIGYVKDNVQWVHKDINNMKWDFSQEHFVAMCKLVALKHQ